MKIKKIFYEKLDDSASSKLIGGFSAAFSSEMQQDSARKVNNCHGGNLKAGCGAAYKVDKKSKNAPNGNCKGNCVKGCGDTLRHSPH